MVNEKRLIPEATADCFEEATKIKTHFAKIIVKGTAENPYYSILYYDPTAKEYYIGYGSYFIETVFDWLAEDFEIVDAHTVDAVEVVRCKDCKQWSRNSGIAESPNGHCFCHDIETNGHDFCSYGERRDNG